MPASARDKVSVTDETAVAWELLNHIAGAMEWSDRVSLLLTREHPDYAAHYAAVGAALRSQQVELALERHNAIPWVIETEAGIGGMAVIEHRIPTVAQATGELRRALAGLKLYTRYRRLPQTA
jgi:hypothetical protein